METQQFDFQNVNSDLSPENEVVKDLAGKLVKQNGVTKDFYGNSSPGTLMQSNQLENVAAGLENNYALKQEFRQNFSNSQSDGDSQARKAYPQISVEFADQQPFNSMTSLNSMNGIEEVSPVEKKQMENGDFLENDEIIFQEEIKFSDNLKLFNKKKKKSNKKGKRNSQKMATISISRPGTAANKSKKNNPPNEIK